MNNITSQVNNKKQNCGPHSYAAALPERTQTASPVRVASLR